MARAGGERAGTAQMGSGGQAPYYACSMSWQPISRDALLADMAVALDEADDSVRAAWARMRIEPEKWRCSPEGDEGGGFWAVGVSGDSVIWFNDIEGGFNQSPFERRGVIGDYRCNQADFAQFLDTLPEALEAERYAEASPSTEVPASVRGPGSIEQRRTSYWVLQPDLGEPLRVHFSGKREHRLRATRYASLELCAVHSVLSDYTEVRASLFVSGAEGCDPAMLTELEQCVDRTTKGWRQLREYLAGAGRTILTSGSGLLMTAPQSVVTAAADVVRRHGAKASVLSERALQPDARVLLMSDTFIVATAFRFEAARRESPRDMN
jgi:hypothetical protein